jgi:hypothetical protein
MVTVCLSSPRVAKFLMNNKKKDRVKKDKISNNGIGYLPMIINGEDILYLYHRHHKMKKTLYIYIYIYRCVHDLRGTIEAECSGRAV